MSAVLLLGAGVGLGLALVTYGARGRPPSLAVALRTLDRDATSAAVDRRQPGRRASRRSGLRAWAGQRAARADLELVERTADHHAGRKLTAAAAMGVLPGATAAVAGMLDVPAPPAVVIAGTVALTVLGFAVPDVELRGLAQERRAEFVHALSSFLDVTAVLLAGGAGTDSALHTAAAFGDGWPHRWLRAALDRCRLTGQPPWAVLAALGDRLDITELSQLATSLQLAGEQGARVRVTLTQRARALRAAQLAEVERRARSVTEQMSVPVALLAVAFMLFVGFPAVWVVVGEL